MNNKPELILNHYFKKFNELKIEMKFIKDNKNAFLSEEFANLILKEKEDLLKMYMDKINQYENYRLNTNNKEEKTNANKQ